MRKILAISMPDEMYTRLRGVVGNTEYGSVSEYIRELIRNDTEFAKTSGQIKTNAEPSVVEGPDLDTSAFFTRKTANQWLEEYHGQRRESGGAAANL